MNVIIKQERTPPLSKRRLDSSLGDEFSGSFEAALRRASIRSTQRDCRQAVRMTRTATGQVSPTPLWLIQDVR